MEISAARSRFGLRTFPVVEFPAVAVPEDPSLVLPGAMVAEGLRQVVRAASNDDARPLLTGVLLTDQDGGIRMVATDSYRLALRDLEGTGGLGEGQDILVPARALAELQRLTSGTGTGPGGGDQAPPAVDIGVTIGKNEITFTHGPVQITTRLLEGTYPDYRQLIPDHYPNRLHLGKESLIAALRRVRLLVRDNTTPVRLSMRAGGVDLSVVSQEVGDASETVDGDFTGEDLVIAFNPTYLIEGVDAVLGDEVVIETADALEPGHGAGGRARRLPLPADAGPGVLTRPSGRPGRPRRAADEPAQPAPGGLPDLRPGRAGPDPEGTTVIIGPNGTGKTSLSRGRGLPGAPAVLPGRPREVDGAHRRPPGLCPGRARDRRAAPCWWRRRSPSDGRSRAQVNRQPARTRRDLAEAVPVTVFSPEDLGVIQGGPARRRELLDDALRLLDPAAASLLDEVERVLRQRAALLRQAGGRLSAEVAVTLDVWDDRLARAGTALVDDRRALARRLEPWVLEAYGTLAGAGGHEAQARRHREDDPGRGSLVSRVPGLVGGDLAEALAANRATTCGGR